MRAILTAIILLSVSTFVANTAQAETYADIQPGEAAIRAPVGHRQPTPADVTGPGHAQTDKTALDHDNELLDLPAARDPVPGADQVQSEESALAKRIERENDRLDHLLRGICRGC